METRLSQALAVTMDVAGKSLAQATARMIILMAQSARAMTKKSPARRPVAADVHTRAEFITVYRKGGGESRIFKFMFGDPKRGGAGATLKGTWAQAQIIKNRGLAKRSWMWGLKSLKGSGVADSKSIPGVGVLRRILTDKVGGFILTNNLLYLQKILPAGWLRQVEQSAVNKVMKQAETKLLRDWEHAVQVTGGGKNKKPDMAKYVRAA